MLGGVSGPRSAPSDPRLPDGRGYGIRIGLAEVKGISEAEVARIVAGRPYASLSDFWHRAAVSRPVVERLVVAGAFDSIYGLGLDRAGAPAGAGHPARPAAAGRRARPLEPVHRGRGPQGRTARRTGAGRGRAATPLPAR